MKLLASAVILVALLVGVVWAKPTARASHILVKEESKAAQLLEDIVSKGADFSELAKAHSTCPSGRKGGDLGSFSQGMMVKAFDDVIFDPVSKLNQVYGPVKTQFGYHLITIHERAGVEDKEL